MTSIYKKVVIKQIIQELDLMIMFYDSYQKSSSDKVRQDCGIGILESIENLMPYQEVWQRYEKHLELDDYFDSVEIKEEIVEEEEG